MSVAYLIGYAIGMLIALAVVYSYVAKPAASRVARWWASRD